MGRHTGEWGSWSAWLSPAKCGWMPVGGHLALLATAAREALTFISKTRSANGALFKWGKNNRIFAMSEYMSPSQGNLESTMTMGRKTMTRGYVALGSAFWPSDCWPECFRGRAIPSLINSLEMCHVPVLCQTPLKSWGGTAVGTPDRAFTWWSVCTCIDICLVLLTLWEIEYKQWGMRGWRCPYFV